MERPELYEIPRWAIIAWRRNRVPVELGKVERRGDYRFRASRSDAIRVFLWLWELTTRGPKASKKKPCGDEAMTK